MPSLIKPTHDSLHKSRLKKPRPDSNVTNAERIYLAEWKRFNHGTNDKLALILWSDAMRAKKSWPPTPTLRDEAVAASVIQWLATNVGNGFLHSCEHKVGRADFAQARRAEAAFAEKCVREHHRQKRSSARQAFLRKRENREHQRVAQNAVRQTESVKRDFERETRRRKEQRAILVR
jgi:hypothetical protein